MAKKYFCNAYGQKIEITKAQFIAAERASGFRPKYGGDGPATGGFSSGPISYSVVHVPGTPYLED
jgi:hypothetical protein